MELRIYRADQNDFVFLKKLEKICFSSCQQMAERNLRHSLHSKTRTVFVAKIDDKKGDLQVGALIIHRYKKSVRIYSIAILPEYRKWKFGKKLMEYSMDLAKKEGFERITLEVMASNNSLIDWYLQFGFQKAKYLKDYYGSDADAWQMSLTLKTNEDRRKENLIVLEGSKHSLVNIDNVRIVSAKEYISSGKYQKLKNARVFNLCNSYKYQGVGYYVSLLAAARDHRVIPSVTTISDYQNTSVIKTLSYELDLLIQQSFNDVKDNKVLLTIYFGQTENYSYKQLASSLYMLFESPLLQINFTKNGKWQIAKVYPLSLDKVNDEDMAFLEKAMSHFFSRKRFVIPRLKSYRYDLAILVDPKEVNPPSCTKALDRFVKVADKMGIYCEFISKKDSNRICEFDALFIRETTSVNNHTFQMARTAYAEGLVVLDDPWSILRCSNKIFLYERMLLNKIKMPYSKVLSKKEFKQGKISDVGFPLVLKQPDGSFSLGVKKVNDEKELQNALSELFKTSELVIAQEYMPSQYDWRIGILDNKPLFACKYYMAKGHWQIYNWAEQNKGVDGDSETLDVTNVPSKVIQVATKAASLMGDGLYGVDLKEINGEVFLIEVNDNPNIDYGIEDLILKDALYEKVIDSFVRRIELSKDMSKYVSADPI
ncbi:GNAT family N-acetyltransferase [Labilibaculum sp.]|uniref:GNAT family N-acetyltransferase n=1 Tax=Labilibaculum sp. TaxID=2060723 RepID=UPI0035643222